jgi:hypothetical protein
LAAIEGTGFGAARVVPVAGPFFDDDPTVSAAARPAPEATTAAEAATEATVTARRLRSARCCA